MIGVFDSGIGGLTLLKQLMDKLPDEEFIYYADTKNVPYSYKTPQQILGFVEEAVLFLRSKSCKAIVLACNTATNVAVEYLRTKYDFPIIAIQPAVKVAFDNNLENKRILACATPVTLTSDRFNNLIDSLDINHLVDRIPLPGLVEFAEKSDFDSESVLNYLQNEFKDINIKEYSYIVLGCTHFTFYDQFIEKNFPPIKAVDGNEGTARHLKNVLESLNLLSAEGQSSVSFYESGNKVVDETRFRSYLARLA